MTDELFGSTVAKKTHLSVLSSHFAKLFIAIPYRSQCLNEAVTFSCSEIAVTSLHDLAVSHG